MKLWFSAKFWLHYERASLSVRKAMKKQMNLLVQDIRHPSLHAKKYDEANDKWQARVTKGWRFYFTIEGDTYHLRDIKLHPK